MNKWGNLERTTLFMAEHKGLDVVSKEFANEVLNKRTVINKGEEEQYDNEMEFINDFNKA